MEAQTVTVAIDMEKRHNRPPLYTAWCGQCRWGEEMVGKGMLKEAIQRHIDSEHEGQGGWVDNTLRMQTFKRFQEA